MKVGDLVRPKVDTKNAPSDLCSHTQEVIEDCGETIRIRCILSSEKRTTRKEFFYVTVTLERRLEGNDLKPVMGTNL